MIDRLQRHLIEAQMELASWLIDWQCMDGRRLLIVQEVQVVAAPAKEYLIKRQEMTADYLFHVGVNDGNTLRLFLTCRLLFKKKFWSCFGVYSCVPARMYVLYMYVYVT